MNFNNLKVSIRVIAIMAMLVTMGRHSGCFVVVET